MEYSDTVFVKIIYWVRCAVNRCAFQSSNGFLISSNGIAGKGVTPIFFDNFCVSRKIISKYYFLILFRLILTKLYLSMITHIHTAASQFTFYKLCEDCRKVLTDRCVYKKIHVERLIGLYKKICEVTRHHLQEICLVISLERL
jgi:hypothetical protein